MLRFAVFAVAVAVCVPMLLWAFLGDDPSGWPILINAVTLFGCKLALVQIERRETRAQGDTPHSERPTSSSS